MRMYCFNYRTKFSSDRKTMERIITGIKVVVLEKRGFIKEIRYYHNIQNVPEYKSHAFDVESKLLDSIAPAFISLPSVAAYVNKYFSNAGKIYYAAKGGRIVGG